MIRLREIRKARKMTQADLAYVLRVGRSTIALWETGRSSPDVDMLIRIADSLQVSIDDLCGHKADTLPLSEASARIEIDGRVVTMKESMTVKMGDYVMTVRRI